MKRCGGPKVDNLWKNPCKPKCPKRSMTCHATCGRYKLWAYRRRMRNRQLKAEEARDKPEKERRAAMKTYRLKKKMRKA